MNQNSAGQFQFYKKIHREAIPGLILLAVAVLTMILANSNFSQLYFSLIQIPIGSLSLQLWVNDGLMVLFFFMVGMEIKKEMISGELSTLKKASLPLAGAIGGMLLPALIYYSLNPAAPAVAGWGIPMATDIAFALGALSLLGNRIPKSLTLFLMALAVIDDLGAILVIAFFYTAKLNLLALGLAAIGLAAIVGLQKLKVKSYIAYVFVGLGVWTAFLISGVHATIAGVLIGLFTPLKFPDAQRSEGSFSPLNELVGFLHPICQFFIMPVFAFFNSGVALGNIQFQELINHPVNQGVGLGLMIGKPVGITFVCLIFVSAGLSVLPKGVRWPQLIGVGILAGIGFTMSLFISSLALPPDLEIFSKTGILLGSSVAAIVGYLYLRFLPNKSDSNSTI